jgi:hypothetical protein
MIRMVFAVLLLGLVAGGAGAEPIGDCIPCHREKTPAAVRQWEGSAHARAKVGCEKCHGTDHEKMLRGEARVDMKVCGPCHKKAHDEHKASRHGMGLHSGWGCTRNMPNRNPNECGFCHEEGTLAPKSGVQCARFLKQSSEMGENGCNYCHSVESSCASCHTNHDTDLKIVKDPASCAKCHMGPDHPQWEMWQTSLHGTLNGSKGAELGPDCQRCHMVSGTHNVSIGITKSSAGIPYSGEKFTANREAMLKVCSQCHAPSFARRELTRDDAILKQSLAIVKEAEGIVGDLYDRKLLDPMPDKRPPHPLKGAELVLDSQLLYEDTSHIERLLFKMKKYDYARTIKGAYHQNPAYTHWYGNAELKMDLVDVKAEASRLGSRRQPLAQKSDGSSSEEQLRVLKSRMERGGMTSDEYAREKEKVLKEMSVKDAEINSKTP